MSWLLAAPWILVLLLIGYRYATRRPRLEQYEPVLSGPLVSVIIPARNEARNIERCVRSVLATRYTPIEVIVVDDRSSDGTAELVEPAAGRRLRLVRGTEPPPGWFGKQWALVQGYRVAKGELLVFADADTRHEPELLPRAVSGLHTERVELFSVMPRQEMRGFWERLIQPHVFLALETGLGSLARVNRTRTEWKAIANGQFILTPRDAYEGIGTHEAVKDTVVDDVRLAQAYVRAGKDIFLVHGEKLMATRMYGSLREILAGWTKNLASGVSHMMPPLPLVRALARYLMWVPALFWIAAPFVSPIAGVVALITWIAVYAMMRAPVWYAALYPFGAAMVAFIMMRSAWRGQRIEWRGRSYLPGSST